MLTASPIRSPAARTRLRASMIPVATFMPRSLLVRRRNVRELASFFPCSARRCLMLIGTPAIHGRAAPRQPRIECGGATRCGARPAGVENFAGSMRRVLVVDDDEGLRLGVRTFLKRDGYE